jgi:hypothetical protein
MVGSILRGNEAAFCRGLAAKRAVGLRPKGLTLELVDRLALPTRVEDFPATALLASAISLAVAIGVLLNSRCFKSIMVAINVIGKVMLGFSGQEGNVTY